MKPTTHPELWPSNDKKYRAVRQKIYRRKHRASQRAYMAEYMKAYFADKKRRKKHNKLCREYRQSPEGQAIRKAYYHRPEVRKRVLEYKKKYNAQPHVRAKRRIAHRKYYLANKERIDSWNKEYRRLKRAEAKGK